MSGLQYFVGIGAQKAGTTWLADYFYRHPQVFMTPYKEMNFFNSRFGPFDNFRNFRNRFRRRNDDLAKYGPANAIATPEQVRDLQRLYLRTCFGSLAAYRAFIDYGAAGKRAAGEITPIYTDLTAATFGRIADTLPGCRFLLLVRNPVDRFLSQVGMDRAKENRRGDRPLADLLGHRFYRRRSDYPRTIRAVHEAVGPERLHVTFFEDLFDPEHSAERLAAICGFLGIDPLPGEIDRVSNRGRDTRVRNDADRRLLVAHYAPVYRFMRDHAGGYLPASWARDLEGLDAEAAAGE